MARKKLPNQVGLIYFFTNIEIVSKEWMLKRREPDHQNFVEFNKISAENCDELMKCFHSGNKTQNHSEIFTQKLI